MVTKVNVIKVINGKELVTTNNGTLPSVYSEPGHHVSGIPSFLANVDRLSPPGKKLKKF